MAEIRYWDSDCFLGYLNEEEDKVDLCQDVLDEAEKGKILIVTSALTITEVLWLKDGRKIVKEKSEKVRSFFLNDFIVIKNVTREIARMAQNVVWDYSVEPKDSIHVATAMKFKIPLLNSFDGVLIGISGKVGNPLIKIEKPSIEQRKLPLDL